jgi:hypothetical protein
VRLADAFAKLGGGSLLTATLLLLVNGQVNAPVLAAAVTALLIFVGSTIRWSARIDGLPNTIMRRI